MDIVVAVPLAAAIQFALVPDEHRSRRWTDVVAWGMLTATWLIGFRTADPLLRMTTTVAWPAVVATAWWPLRRQRRASLALIPDSSSGPSILAMDSEQIDRDRKS